MTIILLIICMILILVSIVTMVGVGGTLENYLKKFSPAQQNPDTTNSSTLDENPYCRAMLASTAEQVTSLVLSEIRSKLNHMLPEYEERFDVELFNETREYKCKLELHCPDCHNHRTADIRIKPNRPEYQKMLIELPDGTVHIRGVVNPEVTE